MPTNQLAPPDMPWLTGNVASPPNGLGPPLLNYAAPPPDTTQGAGVAAAGQQAWQWLQDQRAESVRQGLLDPNTGLPTQAGLVQGVGQTAQGVMMGTTAPGDVPPPGIVAYHGSPADFDRFDDRFIGTGEGAQVYGRGHYFGGAEETGRNYRDALTPETIPNPEFNAAQQDYNAKYGAVGNAAGATDAEFNAAIAARDAAHEKMKSLPPTIPNPAFPGRMYQVNIGADPEHFLDWDKPLSEQSQHVQEALGKVSWAEPYLQSGKFPGSQIAPNTPEGAQQLRDAGVAGIKYLDQGSRNAGGWHITPPDQTVSGKWMVKSNDYNSQGMHFDNEADARAALDQKIGGQTHNYVVFDASTIDILRKYGIAGLIAGGGAAAAGTQQQQPQPTPGS